MKLVSHGRPDRLAGSKPAQHQAKATLFDPDTIEWIITVGAACAQEAIAARDDQALQEIPGRADRRTRRRVAQLA